MSHILKTEFRFGFRKTFSVTDAGLRFYKDCFKINYEAKTDCTCKVSEYKIYLSVSYTIS